MVKNQIASRGIKDEGILEAMRKVPRHLFVDEEDYATAYGDFPLTIGFKQTISQPYIVAYMTEALKLRGGEKILEIGTGCGYQTAVLAELAHRVYSMEVVEELGKEARARLDRLGYANISFKIGNGREGWPEEAPYDGIIVTAAPRQLPDELMDQLKPGGRLVIPVGGGDQTLMRYTRAESGDRSESLLAVRFVPLV